jgi:hypothetical protein
MRIKQALFTAIVATLCAIPGVSATLAVDATATPDGSLEDYSYQFSITGAGADVDNIFLGSNDLSPLNVVIKENGSPTSDWSWLGNDTPQNYLQFFDIGGTALGNGDVLDVTFSSAFAPGPEFAVGLASSSSDETNVVNGVLSPSVATPEPGPVPFLVSGIALIYVFRRRFAQQL